MKIKKVFFLLISLTLFFFSCQLVLAQVNQDEVDNKQEEIEKLEKKINDLQGREKTLANEIEAVNDQIALAQLKIQASIAKISKTSADIQKLNTDIESLQERIEKLSESINYQKKLLESRMRESYKSKDYSTVLLFGTGSIGDMIHKLEYLQVMEKHDNVLLEDMRKTKEAFTTQKRLFEEKKAEVEKLKRQLEVEKANLDAQKGSLEDKKSEKERLMKMTQNDEAKYQKMLEDARRELNQITGAVSVLKNSKGVSVKKGEAIGIQGNSGYSFGDHLHFGVYKYSSFADIDGWDWYYSNYIDPAKMLKKKIVYWDTGCESPRDRTVGSGDWNWPLSNAKVTQGFGYTCWSNRYYGGKPHPALDMAGPLGSVVYAAADGKAYACRNCLGDGGNGVFIFHDGGYMTVYWHLK